MVERMGESKHKKKNWRNKVRIANRKKIHDSIHQICVESAASTKFSFGDFLNGKDVFQTPSTTTRVMN